MKLNNFKTFIALNKKSNGVIVFKVNKFTKK